MVSWLMVSLLMVSLLMVPLLMVSFLKVLLVLWLMVLLALAMMGLMTSLLVVVRMAMAAVEAMGAVKEFQEDGDYQVRCLTAMLPQDTVVVSFTLRRTC